MTPTVPWISLRDHGAIVRTTGSPSVSCSTTEAVCPRLLAQAWAVYGSIWVGMDERCRSDGRSDHFDELAEAVEVVGVERVELGLLDVRSRRDQGDRTLAVVDCDRWTRPHRRRRRRPERCAGRRESDRTRARSRSSAEVVTQGQAFRLLGERRSAVRRCSRSKWRTLRRAAGARTISACWYQGSRSPLLSFGPRVTRRIVEEVGATCVFGRPRRVGGRRGRSVRSPGRCATGGAGWDRGAWPAARRP